MMGNLRVFAVCMLDFFLLRPVNVYLALIVSLLLLFYAYAGEIIALWHGQAIRLKRLETPEAERLRNAVCLLNEDHPDLQINRVPIFILPSEDANAYSYGRSIAVTKGMITNCDSMMLAAILLHELSHKRRGDARMARICFGSLWLMLAAFFITQAALLLTTGVIFFIVLLFGGGLLLLLLFHLTVRGVKFICHALSEAVIFLFRMIGGVLSRHAEFCADRFSCRNGYGQQLIQVLRLLPADNENLTLTDLLYASHPSSEKRILKINQYLKTMNFDLANI
ncbi:MAG: M48 family metalloprotease [Bilifractor sp.]